MIPRVRKNNSFRFIKGSEMIRIYLEQEHKYRIEKKFIRYQEMTSEDIEEVRKRAKTEIMKYYEFYRNQKQGNV